MQVAFSTLGCPGLSLEQIAACAKNYAYDAVELRVHEDGEHLTPSVSRDDAERAAGLFARQNTPIFSLSGYSKFVAANPSDIEAGARLLDKLLDLAHIMGAKYVRTFAGDLPESMDRDTAADKAAEALKPLADKAAKLKLKIALETHDHWTSGANVMEIVRRVENRDGLGVLYDVFNCFSKEDESWAVTMQKIRKHIAYVHVKDAYPGPDGTFVYTMLGAGELPWSKILARLKRENFDGTLSFEWERKWHPELEAPERVLPQFSQKIRKLWASV